MNLAEHEYTALRSTIAQRGTIRMVLVPLTLAAWAAMGLAEMAFSPLPLASLISLVVLAAGFEAVHALHVGVERIGRYLQVFYEEASAAASAARWETTAMARGPALPGGGIDPLFTLLFSITTILNLTIGLVPQPTIGESIVIGVLHAVLLVRMVRARASAVKQRARDLEHYRQLRDRQV